MYRGAPALLDRTSVRYLSAPGAAGRACVTYGTDGVVTSLHVRFQQFCEHPTAPRLSGEVSLGPEATVPTLSELMMVMLMILLAAAGVFGIGLRLRV